MIRKLQLDSLILTTRVTVELGELRNLTIVMSVAALIYFFLMVKLYIFSLINQII